MRRRIGWLLPALALSFVCGVVLADRAGLASPAWFPLAAGCALLVPLVARRPSGLAACAVGLSLSLGAARLLLPLEAGQGAGVSASFDAAVEGRLCALAGDSDWVRAELCEAAAVAFAGTRDVASVPARLSWIENARTDEGLWLSQRTRGEWVRARLRLSPLRGLRNPGGRDAALELRRRGVGARARLVDARLAVSDAASGATGVASLRRELAGRLIARGPGGALFAALALGDRSGLTGDARDAFRRLGISHLLAVSGLHLVLVAGFAYAGVRFVGIRVPVWVETRDVRVGAVVAAALAAAGYAVLAGGAVPVRRALVFGVALACASVLGRSRTAAHALAAAALAVAFVDPVTVFSLGAQLSFCATAALLLDRRGSGIRAGRLAGLRSALAAGVRVSATAIAATAPVLAAHGLGSSPFGLIANAVAVPWTAFVLLPAAIAATALVALVPEWHAPIAGLVAVSEGSLRVVCGAAAEVSFAARSFVGVPGWLAGLAVALATLFAGHTRTRVLLAALTCGVLSWAPPDAVTPRPPRVVALDVGPGDALLVQASRAAVLVDGGWALPGGADLGRSVVLPALHALGVDRLDVVVATHADLDHRGGLPAVLREIPVGEVWLPAVASDDFAEVREAAAQAGVPVYERHRDAPRFQRGDLEIEVLWPPPSTSSPLSRNDGSLVLAVTLAGSRLLLTGDIGATAEQALLRTGSALRADVLKVAHHGSRGSSTEAFLRAVSPDIALISSACSALSRLPTREAIARLQASGASIGWTGRDGALLVGLSPGDSPTLRAFSPDPNCQSP